MAKNIEIDHTFLSRNEKSIFYGILIINIIFLFFTKFYPSMDGPAHLYNSNLVKHLILNNDFINDFYQIGAFPIPNWTSHFILSVFGFVFPGWLAEKILLILYISGMALSFRYLVKALRPENILLSIFIFPLIYSFLFHLGFYNYSLSFIFLFLSLAFWVNNYKANRPSLYLVTGIFLILSYFSNILTLGFLGLTLGISIILFEAESSPVFSKQFMRSCVKRITLLALCAVPSLILLYYFFQTVTFPASSEQYDSTTLIKWINDVRCLIVYSYTGEEIITEQYFHLLLILFAFSLFLIKSRTEIKNRLTNPRLTITYLPLILSLVLFFVLPNSSSAGMMSDRLGLMFFILLTTLIITQPIPIKLQLVCSLIVILLHLTLLTKHALTMRGLNKDAVSINETDKYIEPNKIVLPVNLSDNWLESHFSNYLGADKPMVILENYEVEVGWFPLHWNPGAPTILLENKQTVNGLAWRQNANTDTRQIDYIFFYGNMEKKEGDNYKELNEIINSGFKLEYESENKYIQLYKRNTIDSD